jgi:DR2241 stabilising domain/4Fe-4S iron-sulfur cluster binding domain
MVTAPIEQDVTAVLGELLLRFGSDEAIVEGPGPDPGARQVEADPDAIREFVRFDGDGRYRPLSGARSLPRNWHARFTDLTGLSAAVEAIYPLAFEHIAAYEEGRLVTVSLEEVLTRQSGRYASSASLGERGRGIAATALCRGCVRAPVWAGAPVAEGEIPCPEPCSVLVSLCREVAAWEAERPQRRRVDPAVGFAEFEHPGNEIREQCLALLEQHDG